MAEAILPPPQQHFIPILYIQVLVATLSFSMGAKDLNSGPHTCTGSTLSHLPSLRTCIFPHLNQCSDVEIGDIENQPSPWLL